MDSLVVLGPISLAVIGLAVLGLVGLLVCFVVALRGHRVAAPAWGLPAVTVAFLGLFGSWLELGLVLELGERSQSTLAFTLTAAGAGIALEPALLGCAAAGVLATLAAWMLALSSLIRRVEGGRWSMEHALVPALLTAVAAPVLGSMVGPPAAVVALLGGFPCVLAGLRCARREVRAEPVGRAMASARLAVALLAIMGAMGLVQAIRIFSAKGLFDAVGSTASSGKTVLLVDLVRHAHGPAVVLAALLVLAVAAAVVVPVARSAWDRTALVGVAILVLLALPAVGARTLLVERLDDVRTSWRPWYLDRVNELADEGLELPRGTALRMPEEMLTLSASPAGLAVDDLPLPWDAEQQDGLHWSLFRALDSQAVMQADLGYGAVVFRGSLRLQVHRSLTWAQVEPLLRTAVGARYVTMLVAVSSADRELKVSELALVGDTHPEAGSTPPPAPEHEAAVAPLDRFVSLVLGDPEPVNPRIRLEALDGLWRISAPGIEPELARDTSELTQAARRIKDEYPDDEDVVVVPVADTTWGELVAALDAVRGLQNYEDVMFPYPRIVFEAPEPEAAIPQP